MKNDDWNSDEIDDVDYEQDTNAKESHVSNYQRAPQKSPQDAHMSARPANRPPQRGRRRPPRKPPRTSFAVFYIATLLLGVIVCIVVFAIVFSSSVKDDTDKVAVATPPPAETTLPTDKPLAKDQMQYSGVITSIDQANNTITCISLIDNKEQTFIINGDTQMHNKYGENIVLAEFVVGDIISAAYYPKDSSLALLDMEPKAFENKLTTGFTVNPDAKTVTLGNDVYIYDENVMVFYKEKPVGIETIDPIDVLTVKGYGQNIYYIDINKSHGTLAVTGHEKIVDGTIEVDPAIYLPLADIASMTVLEGPHEVIIKGSNIELYTKTITITAGEETSLDLADVQYKKALVSFLVNAEDFVITVDGEVVDENPVELDYGKHTIVVEAEGFLPWKEEVEIKEPTVDLKVEMDESVDMCDLTIDTAPSGAEVYIDNGLVGNSPITQKVPYGKHVIRVYKKGYIETKTTVTVDTDMKKYLITLHELPPEPPAVETVEPSVGSTPEPVLEQNPEELEYGERYTFDATPAPTAPAPTPKAATVPSEEPVTIP